MWPEITFRTTFHAKVIVWSFKPSLMAVYIFSRIREAKTESARKNKEIGFTTVLKRSKKLILFARLL